MRISLWVIPRGSSLARMPAHGQMMGGRVVLVLPAHAGAHASHTVNLYSHRSPLPPASHTSAARPLAGSAAAAQAPGPLGVVDASGSKPVNRTASQIRKAYGRAPSARDRCVGSPSRLPSGRDYL